MLTRIDLLYFKCFETLKLQLRPLTLLAGANGSGKSSVLHALALVHQAMFQRGGSESLDLNGNLVRLGTAADVIDRVQGQGFCEIGLHDDETEHLWKFATTNHDNSLTIKNTRKNGEECYGTRDSESLRHSLPNNSLKMQGKYGDFTQRMRRLSYLSIERIGGCVVYPTLKDEYFPVFERRGKRRANFLFFPMRKPVLENLSLKTADRRCLRQVEARMNQLFPGFKLELQPLFMSKSIDIGLRTSLNQDHLLPINISSGMMHVLPIVVTALCTRPRDILVIEHPELLLHGAGQAAMGMFLAEVASAGVQVLVETHSDHILDGIRRAVKDGILSAEETALYCFRPRTKMAPDCLPQVEMPLIDSNGNLDYRPKGFFDQVDKDMDYFAGW